MKPVTSKLFVSLAIFTLCTMGVTPQSSHADDDIIPIIPVNINQAAYARTVREVSSAPGQDQPDNIIVSAGISFPDKQVIDVEVQNLEDDPIECVVLINVKIVKNNNVFRSIQLGKRLRVPAGKTGTYKDGKKRIQALNIPDAQFQNPDAQIKTSRFIDPIKPGKCRHNDSKFKTINIGCQQRFGPRYIWSAITDEKMDYPNAEAYCKNLRLGGRGWRIPNYEEMRHIEPGKFGRFYLQPPPSALTSGRLANDKKMEVHCIVNKAIPLRGISLFSEDAESGYSYDMAGEPPVSDTPVVHVLCVRDPI